MSKIIRPNEPELLTIKMSPDFARLLASILGEYALRIPNPPEEIFKDRTDEEKKNIMAGHEERKKFAQKVCNSFFTSSHGPEASK